LRPRIAGYNPTLICPRHFCDARNRRNPFVCLNLQSFGEFMTGLPLLRGWHFIVRSLTVLLLWLDASSVVMASTPRDENNQDVRIRLEWMGERPEVWAAILETSHGVFVDPVSLSAGADQAGTLWSGGQSLRLARRNSRRFDGFDVTLRGPRSARICFTLQTRAQGSWQRQYHWSLAEIGRKSVILAADDGTAHLSVRRVPGDELRVSIDRSHLIYHRGEKFRAVLLPDSAQTPVTAAKIEWEIRAARAGRLLSSGSVPWPQSTGQSVRSQLPVEFALPHDEGSFNLRFRLNGNRSDVLESAVQILVLDDHQRGQLEQRSAEQVRRPSFDSLISGRSESIVLASATMPENAGLVASVGLVQRDHDDWERIYTVAQRAAARSRAEGDHCLVLPVLAEGGTSYPSAFFERRPCFDSGLNSLASLDPMQKDVVELLYRVFDRNALELIPEMQFNSPLTALERRLASDEVVADGIELRQADGQTWREVHGTIQGIGPCYNPLEPLVQNAILDVVREFAERYHHHAAYRGIALEVDSRGYLSLPGIEWGCDDATLARFRHDTGALVRDRADLFKGDARSRWTAWRCAELARFYRRLARVVTLSAPEARLVLSFKQVPSPDFGMRIGDTPEAASNADVTAARGIDFSMLEGVSSLVVWRQPPESRMEALAPVEGTLR
jgi:hypothetical protein